MVTEKAETMYERLLRKTLPGRQFQVGNVFVLSGNFSAESSQTIAAKPEKSDESSVSRAVLSSSSPASGARKISKAEQEAPILEWAQSLSPEDPRLRETDPTGRTALHNALHHKYVRVAELLIQKGSDVHHRDQEGFTPLHITAFHGLSEIANLLISKGADVNAQTPSGKTPLTIARMNNYFTLYDFLTKNGGRE
jgi:ankyrin repeat protein